MCPFKCTIQWVLYIHKILQSSPHVTPEHINLPWKKPKTHQQSLPLCPPPAPVNRNLLSPPWTSFTDILHKWKRVALCLASFAQDSIFMANPLRSRCPPASLFYGRVNHFLAPSASSPHFLTPSASSWTPGALLPFGCCEGCCCELPVHGFEWTYGFNSLGRAVARPHGNSMFHCLRSSQTVLYEGSTLLHASRRQEGSFLHVRPLLATVCLLGCRHTRGPLRPYCTVV